MNFDESSTDTDTAFYPIIEAASTMKVKQKENIFNVINSLDQLQVRLNKTADVLKEYGEILNDLQKKLFQITED